MHFLSIIDLINFPPTCIFPLSIKMNNFSYQHVYSKSAPCSSVAMLLLHEPAFRSSTHHQALLITLCTWNTYKVSLFACITECGAQCLQWFNLITQNFNHFFVLYFIKSKLSFWIQDARINYILTVLCRLLCSGMKSRALIRTWCFYGVALPARLVNSSSICLWHWMTISRLRLTIVWGGDTD
jgi:hypothetical protein